MEVENILRDILFDALIDPDYPALDAILRHLNPTGWKDYGITALCQCIRYGHYSWVSSFIDAKVDVNESGADDIENTPLLDLILMSQGETDCHDKSRTAVFKELIAAGADVYKKNKLGQCPEHYITRNEKGDLDKINFLKS